MSGADADGADIKPTLLALGLLALYASFFFIEPVREFFELSLLTLSDIGLIALLALVWAVLVLAMWRARLFERVRNLVRPAPEQATS